MSVVYGVGGVATLELETVDGAPPAVRVTVTGVASATVFALTRLCEGKTITVPEWRARTITDSDTTMDWVAPTNRPVTYNLSVDGTVVASATITLPSPYAWLQDPLQPDKCLKFVLSRDGLGTAVLDDRSLTSFTYKSGTTPIPILGSPEPVVFGGQRQAPSGISHRIRTFTEADTALMSDLIEGTPFLLIRTLPGMRGLPALAYLNGDVGRAPFTTHLPGGQQEYWTVTGDLVAAVMQAAITGSVTYDEVQQLLAGYTYDDVQTLAAATTYLDWQKNPLIFSTL
ncbi:MAG: hypothetical protein M3O29_08195 [Actinomycetota bacterium]|nr:hypothetical protein [Actinomycetota bacterium]